MTSEQATPQPWRQVDYHSYLLRVLTIPDGDRVIRQLHVRDIPSGQEFYFDSLRELMDYLRAQGRLSREEDSDTALDY